MRNGNYELVKAPVNYPGKKYRGRYAYKHHLVWWEATGEIVGYTNNIHHINGDTRDNRLENLRKLTRSAHAVLHNKERRRKEVSCGEYYKYRHRGCRCASCKRANRDYTREYRRIRRGIA